MLIIQIIQIILFESHLHLYFCLAYLAEADLCFLKLCPGTTIARPIANALMMFYSIFLKLFLVTGEHFMKFLCLQIMT